MRSFEQSICSAGVRRWSDGLFARFSGAARKNVLVDGINVIDMTGKLMYVVCARTTKSRPTQEHSSELAPRSLSPLQALGKMPHCLYVGGRDR